MKSLTITVLVLTLLSSGCTQMSMERTAPDGTRVVFSSANLFQNSTMNKLSVDHTTSQTYSGLKIGALENDTNADAMRALGEILGNAAAAAAKKAVVP